MAIAPRGVRYYGSGGLSGYGQAAVAYVRALVNAGIAVQWIPLDWTTQRMVAGAWIFPDGHRQPLLEKCATQGHLADVPALVEQTRAPVAHDVVIVHAPPESWQPLFERGKRNIGMTVWETDRTPAHWMPLMRAAERVIVPCAFNRETFVRDGLDRPVRVVPHIRRHCWREFSPRDIAAARAQLRIPPGNRVFYTSNAWDPRKNMPALIHAFAQAFEASDPVTLLIKTSATGHGEAPYFPSLSTRELAQQVIRHAIAETGRSVAQIVLIDMELDGDDMDLVHALGDVYVSLSHGEGWGLGAFEAATLAKPVVMTGWGGQCEFLGADWPGAVPHALESVPLWPPQRPSYFPNQRWARPDLGAAATLLRDAMRDGEPMQSAMRTIRERIVRDYAEPVMANALIEAIA